MTQSGRSCGGSLSYSDARLLSHGVNRRAMSTCMLKRTRSSLFCQQGRTVSPFKGRGGSAMSWSITLSLVWTWLTAQPTIFIHSDSCSRVERIPQGQPLSTSARAHEHKTPNNFWGCFGISAYKATNVL